MHTHTHTSARAHTQRRDAPVTAHTPDSGHAPAVTDTERFSTLTTNSYFHDFITNSVRLFYLPVVSGAPLCVSVFYFSRVIERVRARACASVYVFEIVFEIVF